MKQYGIMMVLLILASPSLAMPIAPTQKYFPINPVAYTRPMPLAHTAQRPINEEKPRTDRGAMTEEQARLLLSIYPVQN